MDPSASPLERLRDWYDQHLGSSRRQNVLRGVLLGAAAVVLVVPLRPGAKPVIPLFYHPAQSAPHLQAAATPARALQGAVLPAIPRQLDFDGKDASPDAHRLAQWIVDTGDNGLLNFAILDKKNAKLFVFAPGGKLIGATPVLLGYAAGDDTVAGIGKRPLEQVLPSERTTPAGRFRAQPGRNALPEDVVWVDYEAAVSMHRVRLTHPAEHREQRLRSTNIKDRRISYGCINLPPKFFENVVWPNFRHQGGYVYVLPEVKALDAVFPALAQPASPRRPSLADQKRNA